ncbi:hypothetical protein MVG78_18295 [Roseomonas gilardii subsp. gilardii]|uniref:hypothetical protein n=1 Tax=Roseomonas gilardii TaxID=257708 RepID=UPI001FFB1F58|nr:hypothetical protein [Roseomonas gilardii]UPG72419.1 hypothetical protein MVG78_18295 [Roseomonas gilardii subsp. gilardii]
MMASIHRRALLAGAPAALLAPPCAPDGVGVSPNQKQGEAALRHYAEVMARRGDAAISDEACSAWCDQEADAVQALADAPAGDLRTLLRLVEVIGDRLEEEPRRCLMDVEVDLILAIGEQAKSLLRTGAAS